VRARGPGWLTGLRRRTTRAVTVAKVVNDLTPLLDQALAGQPACGPFAASGGQPPLPGRVEYLGGGIVRLDDTALASLAGLPEGTDFRTVFTDADPVPVVGCDRYAAHEGEPETNPAGNPAASGSGG
jgi:hypothetical protein